MWKKVIFHDSVPLPPSANVDTHTRPSDIFEPNIERHFDKIFFTWVSKLINFHTKFEFTYTSETNLKSDPCLLLKFSLKSLTLTSCSFWSFHICKVGGGTNLNGGKEAAEEEDHLRGVSLPLSSLAIFYICSIYQY